MAITIIKINKLIKSNNLGNIPSWYFFIPTIIEINITRGEIKKYQPIIKVLIDKFFEIYSPINKDSIISIFKDIKKM